MVENKQVAKFTGVSVLLSVLLTAILGIVGWSEGGGSFRAAQAFPFIALIGAIFCVAGIFTEKFQKDVISTAFTITVWMVAYIASVAPLYVQLGSNAGSTTGQKLEIAALVFAGLGSAQSFGFGKMLLDAALCSEKAVAPST